MPPALLFVSRSVRKYTGKVVDMALFFDFYLAKLLYSKRQIPNDAVVPKNSNVVFYSVFINNQEQFDHIINHINGDLKHFNVVFLVNTGKYAPNFPMNSRIRYFQRLNKGRDFGSIFFLIRRCKGSISNAKSLIVLNDSVFWKPGKILDFVEKGKTSNCDVFGVTLSNQGIEHLQSFAIYFPIMNSVIVQVLFDLYPFKFKRTMVCYGEKRLSKNLRDAGLHLGAIHSQVGLSRTFSSYDKYYGKDYQSISKRIAKNIKLNPTIHFWPELAISSGVIKKSLFSNPAGFGLSPANNAEILFLLQSWYGDNFHLSNFLK